MPLMLFGAVVGWAAFATGAASASLPPSSVHGSNFQIQLQIDHNYCIQVAGGSQEGRTLSLQQCGTTDTQRWTFTIKTNGLNQVVDSQGMCLDGHFAKASAGLAMTVADCGNGGAWQFTFLPSGLIQSGKPLSLRARRIGQRRGEPREV
jgi:hypothetical protein